jgi:4-hydroxy-tetrahydrodipicolinate reductase
MFWGFGLMNQVALAMMLSLRPAGTVDIVAVVDRNASRKGKKVGDLLLANQTVRDQVLTQPGTEGSKITTDIPTNVSELVVLDPTDVESIISETKPDVCMLATRAFLKEIEDQLTILIRHRVDVMTIAEEMLFPMECEVPEVAKRLEDEARKSGVRILGTGFNDSGWIILALSGASMVSFWAYSGTRLVLNPPYSITDDQHDQSRRLDNLERS